MPTMPVSVPCPATPVEAWPCPDRIRPSVLIIGAQKCGTTSLFKYLRELPRLRLPRVKESRFFDKKWDRGLAWYARQFPKRSSPTCIRLTLDASPASLFDPLAPARAARVLPDALLIVLLRNPVERAFSHYRHNRRRGRAVDSFEAEIEREPARLAAALTALKVEGRYINKDLFHASYLARGRYVEQLRAWTEHFDPSRLIVLHAESMFADPQRTLDTVTDAMSQPRHRLRSKTAHGFGGSHEPMRPETRATLEDYFAPFNIDLAGFLKAHNLDRGFDWSTKGAWPGPSR